MLYNSHLHRAILTQSVDLLLQFDCLVCEGLLLELHVRGLVIRV